jgi:hypothetical protein
MSYFWWFANQFLSVTKTRRCYGLLMPVDILLTFAFVYALCIFFRWDLEFAYIRLFILSRFRPLRFRKWLLVHQPRLISWCLSLLGSVCHLNAQLLLIFVSFWSSLLFLFSFWRRIFLLVLEDSSFWHWRNEAVVSCFIDFVYWARLFIEKWVCY